jgi:hypothetical protein
MLRGVGPPCSRLADRCDDRARDRVSEHAEAKEGRRDYLVDRQRLHVERVHREHIACGPRSGMFATAQCQKPLPVGACDCRSRDSSGNRSELSQDPELVEVDPVLDDPVVHDP